MDVVANNLANANSTGFKRQRVGFEATGPSDAYARIADGLYDQRDGNLTATGNPLDVALRGPGWLLVDGVPGVGGPVLTRDGHIHVDPSTGVLRNATGGAVLGGEGPIVVPLDQTLEIDQDGTVWASEDGPIATLRVVEAAARPLGGNLWTALGTLQERTPTLIPGSLEQSNVEPTLAMVELIDASRSFEMLQNVIRTSDELDSRLNSFGRGS